MIETISTNVVRCDMCNHLIGPKEDWATVYSKDMCSECSVEVFMAMAHSLVTKEDFEEVFDDLKTYTKERS